MTSIKTIESQTEIINVNLTSAIAKLHAPKINLKKDEKSINKVKDKLSDIKQKQKNLIKVFENDKKRYKVLKKFGEVLELVEKLLNLIPGELSNLSTEELESKLEELLRTRTKNNMQIHFIFYQNLVTDLLTNLLTTEKNYQEGKISSAEALKDVRDSKQQIKEHSKEFPPILKQTVQEVSYLVKLFEDSYSAENVEKTGQNPDPLKETELSLKHELLFDKLNNDTTALISKVESLSQDLSNFEPHIDVTKITTKLQASEDCLSVENWDVDKLDATVGDLKSTTLALTDEQVEINNKNEGLTTEIKDITNETMNLSQESITNFSVETYKDIEKRAQEDKQVSDEIIDIIEEDTTLSTTVGVQVANTIIAQVEADEEFSTKNAINPNAEIELLTTSELETALNSAYDLKDKVLTVEEKRELLLKLEKEKEENNG